MAGGAQRGLTRPRPGRASPVQTCFFGGEKGVFFFTRRILVVLAPVLGLF